MFLSILHYQTYHCLEVWISDLYCFMYRVFPHKTVRYRTIKWSTKWALAQQIFNIIQKYNTLWFFALMEYIPEEFKYQTHTYFYWYFNIISWKQFFLFQLINLSQKNDSLTRMNHKVTLQSSILRGKILQYDVCHSVCGPSVSCWTQAGWTSWLLTWIRSSACALQWRTGCKHTPTTSWCYTAG